MPLAFLGLAAAQDISEIDLQIGFNRHNQISQSTTVISSGALASTVAAATQRMTSVLAAEPNGPPHRVYLLDTPTVNAFASGGGRAYVTTGIAQALEGNEGMLAFVIGHEMAHNQLRHVAHKYIRALEFERMRRYYDNRCRAGENASCWASLGHATVGKMTNKKIEREDEHAADRLGLALAARAGYHPDFTILAARQLRAAVGEQSKFAAFFSDHPRWSTREDRAEDAYDEAVALFEKFWPSLEASPGGRPTAMASLRNLQVAENKDGKAITGFARIRHLKNPAMLKVTLEDEKGGQPLSILEQHYVDDERSATIRALLPKALLKRKRPVSTV